MEEKKLSLPEIHAELIEQLRDVIAVCERHGIEYNLMCGTLLGAVRHKGFIPWDDDVDLLMTRANFEKFRVVYPKECDQRFELTYLDTWTPRVMNRDPEKAAAFTDFFIQEYRLASFIGITLKERHDTVTSRKLFARYIRSVQRHAVGIEHSEIIIRTELKSVFLILITTDRLRHIAVVEFILRFTIVAKYNLLRQ